MTWDRAKRERSCWGSPVELKLSALEKQAADALRRARRLPIGADRNDLRQLAMGLLWLHRNGMAALMKRRLDNAAGVAASIAGYGRETHPAAEEPQSGQHSKDASMELSVRRPV